MAGESTEAAAAPVDIRAEILAELAAKPAEEPAAEPAAEEPAAEVEPEAEPAEATDDEPEATDDEPDPDLDDEDDEPTSADPETQKRLDAVRKAEKRSRAKIEQDRAAFEQERQQWADKVRRAEEIEALARRAKYDPVAVMRALGIDNEDDLELVAHAIYAEGKTAKADPKNKAAAMARLKEREKEDKLSTLERETRELKERLEAQQKQAAAQAEAARYIEQINTAATTKYPLVAHMLKADADETSDALVATYDRLVKTTGKQPKAVEVVAAFDKAQRTKLQRLGVDPASIVKPKAVPAAKPAANANAAKQPAKPATAAPTSGDPTKDEILAELAALNG